MAWIALLVVRLVDLQVVRGREFAQKARRQQERTVELPPRRGAIVDREGRDLAVTALVDSVFAIPSDVEDAEETAQALAPLLRVPVRELKKKLSEADRDFVWLARRVDEATAKNVASLRIEGVRLIKESTRRYPQGPLAASVLGYVGLDNQGLAGLEHHWDAMVKGRPSQVTFLRDAAQRSYAAADTPGRLRTRTRLGEEVEGASLSLTLDVSIQHLAERELAKALEERSARGGSVVVMDPSTGALLALASGPGFDPNRYGASDPEQRKCRAVADLYEPGSTFKVLTVAAALDAGAVGPDDIIDCGGGSLTVGNVVIHEHGKNRWGTLPLVDVLAHSSNIGAAHLGMAVGKNGFFRSIRSYGFGQKSGIDLDGETSGMMRDVSGWSNLTLPTMSFGQEIGVTVLQMARAYSAVANGGILPQPHVVAAVRTPDGRQEVPGPRTGTRVMSAETSATLRRLMTKVVDGGTGKLASVPGFTVAGKTGTAQKAAPGGGYSRDRYVASFIGFVPAEAPRVVIAVVIDEPKGKIYGGDVAAPVFAAVAGETLRILGEPARPEPSRVTPTYMTADLERASAPGPRQWKGDLVGVSSRGARAMADPDAPVPAGSPIPDLSGLSAREAVRLLARHGLSVRLAGHGSVVAQDPSAGAPAAGVGSVSLTLSPEPLVAGEADSR